MDDVYVRKDTFEETMKRMEAMQAASEARTAALIAEIRAEVKAYKADSDAKLEVYRADSKRESESLSADIKSIRDMLNMLMSRTAVWQGVLGFVLGLCAVIIAGVQVYLAVKG